MQVSNYEDHTHFLASLLERRSGGAALEEKRDALRPAQKAHLLIAADAVQQLLAGNERKGTPRLSIHDALALVARETGHDEIAKDLASGSAYSR